jgi:glycosyltransferase involved in cell wall biosynthesis
VGRVSWEKNLHALSQAYIDIHAQRKDVHLVITGDGPARMELEARFANAKAAVTFTGYLEGMYVIHCFSKNRRGSGDSVCVK